MAHSRNQRKLRVYSKGVATKITEVQVQMPAVWYSSITMERIAALTGESRDPVLWCLAEVWQMHQKRHDLKGIKFEPGTSRYRYMTLGDLASTKNGEDNKLVWAPEIRKVYPFPAEHELGQTPERLLTLSHSAPREATREESLAKVQRMWEDGRARVKADIASLCAIAAEECCMDFFEEWGLCVEAVSLWTVPWLTIEGKVTVGGGEAPNQTSEVQPAKLSEVFDREGLLVSTAQAHLWWQTQQLPNVAAIKALLRRWGYDLDPKTIRYITKKQATPMLREDNKKGATAKVTE